MSDNTILELQNVSLTFGGLKAVSDVNFKMKDNEILSLKVQTEQEKHLHLT